MLLMIIIFTIINLSLFVFHFFCLLLEFKCFPDSSARRKFSKIIYDPLITLLKSPQSIILVALCILLSMILNGLLPFFPNLCLKLSFPVCFVLMGLFVSVYFGYIASLVYFKSWKKIIAKKEINLKHIKNLFRYIKAVFSAGILISTVFIIMWRASFPLLNLILQYMVDRNIFVSQSIEDHTLTSEFMLSLCTRNVLLSSERILSLFNNMIVILAFTAPAALLLVRYSFIFFSTLYFHKKEEFINIPLPTNALTECMLDLAFFFVVFGLNLWLQSIISSLDLHKIAWSLVSSLLAASFREYLEAIAPWRNL